jgi:MSHA pilin protein MshD
MNSRVVVRPVGMQGMHGMRGMTLIELVIAISVIAIAVSSVLGLMSAQATRSAEAMLREQAAAIAAAYLAEITQKKFSGPGCCSRAAFDSVDDYHAPAFAPVRDQWGTAVPGLGDYQVAVTVTASALNGIPAAQSRLVSVTVRHSSGVTVLHSGYKTSHP